MVIISSLAKGELAGNFKNALPKKVKSEAQIKQAKMTKLANKRAWAIYHKTVESWIEKNWTGKGWKRVQFETQDYFPLCLKRAWKEIKTRESVKKLSVKNEANLETLSQEATSPSPSLTGGELKTRKTRMNDKARLIVLAFNETGQIAKEAIKKAKKSKVSENQGNMFSNEKTNNNQISLF